MVNPNSTPRHSALIFALRSVRTGSSVYWLPISPLASWACLIWSHINAMPRGSHECLELLFIFWLTEYVNNAVAMHNKTRTARQMLSVVFASEKLSLDAPKNTSNIENVIYSVTGIVAVPMGTTGIDIGANMQATGNARKIDARNNRGIVALFEMYLADGTVTTIRKNSKSNHTPTPNIKYSKIVM